MDPLVVKYSAFERSIYVLLALAVPVTLAVGVTLSDDHPDAAGWIAFAIYDLLFCWLTWIAFRFVLRVDEEGIYHREIVTRWVPLSEVYAIQIAREKKGPFRHLKVHVEGKDGRIMVAWRESKMRPVVERLKTLFPGKIQEISHLPDM